ncbi:hypothetical protein EE612_051207 [Oryza sativa]|nr:hypothetical protein EE612_051207 [Oryza sativa]
MTSHPNAAQTH